MAQRGKGGREETATLHLHLWLGALHRTLSRFVALRRDSMQRQTRNPAPANRLSSDQATALLETLEQRIRSGPVTLPPVKLTRREENTERDLISDAPTTLPLVRLRDAGLTSFDRSALLTVTAPEILPETRALYGFALDDMGRCNPSVELILALTNEAPTDLGQRLRRLGPGGPLRRLGLLNGDTEIDTRQTMVLRPAPGLVEWILGARAAPPVPLADLRMILPASVSKTQRTRALDPAVRCLGSAANSAAGLWGNDVNKHDDAVAELARRTGRPVYRTIGGETFETWWPAFHRDAAVAAGADALIWVETRALPTGADMERAAMALARMPQRIILTGRHAWRPLPLVGTRPYADVILPDLLDAGDWAVTADTLPEEAGAEIDRRHRLGFRARRAAEQMALSDCRNRANGTVPDLSQALARSAKKLATPAHLPSVQVVEPRRTLDDLVLPDGNHAQIAEMGMLAAEAVRVDAEWGFGRLTGSHGALKALFTGDSGTGKTLAAEVVAGAAGAALMKIDLSQVVSKWVGETEKNLEAIFDHAEQSRAALFFDEADSLFGKRGEVRHGTDRYANLEVSYLLQRLESYSGGLLILASNLRDGIDPAFTRRFQISMHFQRPALKERVRLWQMAFQKAPLASGFDFQGVAGHDLTGGGIVTAARMAALLAAGEGASCITRCHVDAAIERQFRKEARLASTGRPDGLSAARARN